MSPSKVAHRTDTEKVAGYLNAAQVALGIAARLAVKDPKLRKRIEAVIVKIEALK